jgi:integrase
MAWAGGNQESETARPRWFAARLGEIQTGITVQTLAEIYKLPVAQMLSAMRDLGETELQALDSIERLCNEEIAFLLRRLKPNTVASVITQYKRELDAIGFNHNPYQLYFKLPIELMKTRKENYKAAVMAENKALRPFSNADGYIERARAMMKSKKSYMRVAMGLAAVTGRRPGEILVTAEFTPIPGNDFMATFKGQLKTKGSEKSRDNYTIPLLAPVGEIIDALSHLRAMRNFTGIPVPPGKTLGQMVNSKTAKQQGEECRAMFSDYVPEIHPYNLRAIYALLCKTRFKPADMTEQAYLASILGHSEDDSTTAASYLDFYLQDGNTQKNKLE